MVGDRIPNYCVLDDFLPPARAQALHQMILSRKDILQPSAIGIRGDDPTRLSAGRNLSVFDSGLGEHAEWYEQAVLDRFADLCAACGLAAFAIHRSEFQICVHRDGNFFERHIDTDWGAMRRDSDRQLTTVYYCSPEPLAFAGGELQIFPVFGDAPPHAIAPRFNRLVAFPSFAIHGVTRVSCPGDSYENARFSINCWIHRSPQ